MIDKGKIITVGLSPAWDVTCHMDSIEWGQTKKITNKNNIKQFRNSNPLLSE